MSFAISQYRAVEIGTGSPANIVVQLYDGAIQFLTRAADAIDTKAHAERGIAINRAHAIVSELQATLEFEHAPELCAQLDGVYTYVLSLMSEANVKADRATLEPAIRILRELRGAWAKVAREAP